MTTTSRTLAIADEGDLLATFIADDLRTLIEIAHLQVSDCDEEEIAAYGLTLDAAERLTTLAEEILGATAPECPEVGDTIDVEGALYTIKAIEPHHEPGSYVFVLDSGPSEPTRVTRGGYAQ